MKNKFKKLFAFGLLMFGFMNYVQADAPSSMSLNTATKLQNYMGANYYITLRKDNNGQYIYCLDFGKTSPSVGTTFTRNGQLDAGVTYIMANGYPNKTFTGNESKDYFITQSALWWYQGSVNGGKKLDLTNITNNNAELGGYIKNLYNGAINAKNKGYVESTITINTSSMTFGQSGDYYVSNIIDVNFTGDVLGYNVYFNNAPEGTKVYTSKNEETDQIINGDDFYIKVPVSSVKEGTTNFTVYITATCKSNKAYIYKPADSSIQSMTSALLTSDNKELNATVNASITKSIVVKKEINNAIYISKQDITSKEELPGAKLIVKDSKGNIIDSWISTKEAHLIQNLKEGIYTLTEETAPDGYELSSETITFEIKDGEVAGTVIMYNTKKKASSEEVIETKKTSSSNVIFYVIFGILASTGAALVYKNRNVKQK